MSEASRSGWRHVWRVLWMLSAVAVAPATAQTTADRPVTFSKDVAPILQKACQQCHRPDSIAPMSLITYQQTRPWARAIKQRTQLAFVPGMRGVMPPWQLERNIGIQHIQNDVRLTDKEIELLAKWADSGAPASIHFSTVAICSSVIERSFLNFWMPTVRSICQGGICLSATRARIERAHGRTS